MDIKIIEQNLDYISINYLYSRNGNPEVARFLKEELVNQIIADTTLAHNRWERIAGKSNTYRGTGGFTLLAYSNRIVLQVSGEAFLNSDEFDIKDILNRYISSLKKNRRFDLEMLLEKDPSISVGRLDSQITIAIHKCDVAGLFDYRDLKIKGRIKDFFEYIGNDMVFTGLNWIKKKRQFDYYSMTPDELKRAENNKIDSRDFLRIYDKLFETIDTTDPHDPKRAMVIDKYSGYLEPEYRIFRIEIQENDRRLTPHLSQILNEDIATFFDVSAQRFEKCKKRNPSKIWDTLIGLGILKMPKPK